MTSDEFSVKCHNCNGEVSSYLQKIEYFLTPDIAHQAGQVIELSCGCVVDFPDWQLNMATGECKIVDFSGRLYIEFTDIELIMEEDD
jgi:hypothetical protein